MIGVMYGSGLRVQEVLDLHPRDIDPQMGTLRVRRGKNSKDRLVGIDPYALGLLERWLDERKKLGLTARHPVFAVYETGRVGRPLDPRYVRTALARLGARAGITKRVHPHGLRHSFAFDLAQSGAPMHQIQAQLGHASLTGTERYISHIAPLDTVAMMRQRTWEET